MGQRSRHWAVPLLAAVLAATGACTTSPDHDELTGQPPPRTSWKLQHRVVESDDLRVVGHSIDRFQESTTVSLGAATDTAAPHCSVSVSAPGTGGPDNWVGEKIATQFRGRPAVRNGTGAEGSYLMWQRPDSAWVEVVCGDPDDPAPVDRVAAAARLSPAPILIPFSLDELPEGYQVDIIFEHLEDPGGEVYLSPVEGNRHGQIVVSFQPQTLHTEPTGRPITVAGRPAQLDEEPRGPGVCVTVSDRYVCVNSSTTDTGPFPDRSDEIPTLLSTAESLTFATDLDDPATWFHAERVFG